MKYNRIDQLGIVITENQIEHIEFDVLDKALKNSGIDRDKFSEYFGMQTCHEGGLYPWDVEPVLERLMSGKLTGTQLYWD
jgi:hypothetical protein